MLRYPILLLIVAVLAVIIGQNQAEAESLRYDCKGDNSKLPEFVSFDFDDRTLEFKLLKYAPAGLSNSDKIIGPEVEGGILYLTIEFYVEGYVQMRESHTLHFDTMAYFAGQNFYAKNGNLAKHGPQGKGFCVTQKP